MLLEILSTKTAYTASVVALELSIALCAHIAVVRIPYWVNTHPIHATSGKSPV